MPNGQVVYAYIPDLVKNNPDEKVPIVLVLHHTGGNPASIVDGCGWADKAAEDNFIVVSPKAMTATLIPIVKLVSLPLWWNTQPKMANK